MRTQTPLLLKSTGHPHSRTDHGSQKVFDLKSTLLDLSGGVKIATAGAGHARQAGRDRIPPQREIGAGGISPRDIAANSKKARPLGAEPGVSRASSPTPPSSTKVWTWISGLVSVPVIAMASRFARSVEEANPDHWYHD